MLFVFPVVFDSEHRRQFFTSLGSLHLPLHAWHGIVPTGFNNIFDIADFQRSSPFLETLSIRPLRDLIDLIIMSKRCPSIPSISRRIEEYRTVQHKID